MAGVPHHAASAYMQRLLEQGFKVAICEQMADPSKVKGIVPREVVRVVTPGIAYDDAGSTRGRTTTSSPSERDGAGPFGIAALDLSTGELSACEAADAGRGARRSSCGSIRARCSCGAAPTSSPRPLAMAPRRARSCAARPSRSPTVEADRAPRRRCSERGRRARRRPRRWRAGPRRGASRRARVQAGRVRCPSRASRSTSSATRSCSTRRRRRHLELVRAVDGGTQRLAPRRRSTRPGRRRARACSAAACSRRARSSRRSGGASTASSSSSPTPGSRAELRQRLADVGDLERLAVKLALDRAAAARSRRAAALARRAARRRRPPRRVPRARRARGARRAASASPGSTRAPTSTTLLVARARRRAAAARVATAASSATGFDAELDEARELMRGRPAPHRRARGAPARDVADPEPQAPLHARLRLVHRGHAARTWRRRRPPGGASRRSPAASATRATSSTPSPTSSRTPRSARAAREAELFDELVRDLAAHAERLRAVAARLAAWDVAGALAEVAHRDDYARPEVDDSLELVLEDARHPVVERLAAAGRFVPNDVVARAAGRAAPAPLARHRPEHGRQVDAHAPGRARRDPRADGLVRARAARAHRRRRSRAHARRRERQPRRAARARSWSR